MYKRQILRGIGRLGSRVTSDFIRVDENEHSEPSRLNIWIGMAGWPIGCGGKLLRLPYSERSEIDNDSKMTGSHFTQAVFRLFFSLIESSSFLILF